MSVTTRADISEWFDEGVEQGATHMIVACDTFDHEDYPSYVMPDQNVQERYDHYNGNNMQRVMEVYDLRKPKDAQIAEARAFNF